MAVGKPAQKGSRQQAKERLLVEAAQKDPARFSDLYELNFERVYAFVVRRVRDRHIAEDITSEVFHKALAHLANFDWRGIPFAGWLLRIAANVISDQWRRSAREVVTDNPPESSVDAGLDEAEHRARVFRMVDELPADQRRVIAMRFAEGKSIREIAHELGRTEGAIKQLQFRGLQTLRAQLGETHA
ncbi:MAG TPA: sigma-70 family RNA polymerase sigma factor [Terriglobales bacterium]|nr:sigma-70 family RNA polymerase sigma factor [Terriglobales bacterium]